MVCHSLLQWTTFCQNSPLWLFHLGWPYMTWLIASLSYTSPLSMYSQSYGFSSSHVEMWELDHRKRLSACQRTDAFKLGCWRRLLRDTWTTRISSQSILKEINPEYSLEELMLKLKLQYFVTWCNESTHWKRPWCWVRLKAKGEGGSRDWDGWMASPTQWTWVWANSWR